MKPLFFKVWSAKPCSDFPDRIEVAFDVGNGWVLETIPSDMRFDDAVQRLIEVGTDHWSAGAKKAEPAHA